jgi:hypothetical protein
VSEEETGAVRGFEALDRGDACMVGQEMILSSVSVVEVKRRAAKHEVS